MCPNLNYGLKHYLLVQTWIVDVSRTLPARNICYMKRSRRDLGMGMGWKKRLTKGNSGNEVVLLLLFRTKNYAYLNVTRAGVFIPSL